MFSICTLRNNTISYLLWRWILGSYGDFIAWLDKFYLGQTRGLNDYDALAPSYKASNIKPDKQYSILPTVLKMIGDCNGKSVIDLGCGAGFFTVPLSEAGASVVCGVDNSCAQIDLAREISHRATIFYRAGDIFTQHGGPVDIVNAPFVVNYALTVSVLKHFFKLVHRSLRDGGKVAFVVDLPNGKSLKRFGAVKMFLGPSVDETRIRIDLHNNSEKICTLFGVYYTPQTIERLLSEVGFRQICWHKPFVTDEGIQSLGADFWKGYTDDPELGYLTAEK